MIDMIIKTVTSGLTEAVKMTTEAAMLKVRATFAEVKAETREMASEFLHSAQGMLLDTLLVAFLFVMGLFYLGDGLTKLIDVLTMVPGTGATALGLLFLVLGYYMLVKSRERIAKIKTK